MPWLSPGRRACAIIGCWLALHTPALGRAAEVERVKFETFDQVEINGTFYPSTKGKKAPSVILLHAIGSDSHQDGWDELAKKLQEKGYAVLTFDFRGHGDSKHVEQGFWRDPYNQALKGNRAGKNKDEISFKDFTTLYNYAYLVNDIAAAKRQLDRKNDAEECNSSNLFLIGAESGATLGAFWAFTEWQRAKIVNTGVLGIQTRNPNQKEGQDISGAVWLSIVPTLGKAHVNLSGWLSNKDVSEKVPMLFLYGEKDTKAASVSKSLFTNSIKGEKRKLSFLMPVKDTSLSGRELLGNKLETQDLIVKYLLKLEDQSRSAWTRKDADRLPLPRVPVERFPLSR